MGNPDDQTRQQIIVASDDLTKWADTISKQWLEDRHRAGKPTPPNWRNRILAHGLGQAALLTMMTQNPDFQIEDAPDALRKLLTHPIHDHPATDEDLRLIARRLKEKTPCQSAPHTNTFADTTGTPGQSGLSTTTTD